MTQKRNDGFTLVELMTAIAFISFLLLAIAGVVIQMSNLYNRGMALKLANQAGRAVVSDMKRTIGESGNVTFITQPSNANATDIPISGGRLCTGTYSYVWNIGTEYAKGNIANKYSDTAHGNTPLHIVKVQDNSGAYCQYDTLTNRLIPIDYNAAKELFANATGSLDIQCMQINQLDGNCTQTPNGSAVQSPGIVSNALTGSSLYNVSMVISNADNDAIDAGNNNCKPPSDTQSNLYYCAVNVFNFVIRTGGDGGGS